MVSSVLPKAATFFRGFFATSTHANKTIKIALLLSATFHFFEFAICNVFFAQISTPFFVPPIATPVNGEESFLYAHSIIRQYGFFVVQLSLLAVFAATQPVLYRDLIRLLASVRLLTAGFGLYMFAHGELTLVQAIPSVVVDVLLAAWLLAYCPRERVMLTKAAELTLIVQKKLFGITLTPLLQYRLMQALCVIAGATWMLWGLGSTVFWEIGVANISSDGTAQANLLNAMQANHLVRNQQGIMLFAIGAATALGAYFPFSHLRIIEFVMAQQLINALSAVIELLFGTILLTQFLTVFSVQVVTFLLFYALYPKDVVTFKNDVKQTT